MQVLPQKSSKGLDLSDDYITQVDKGQS